MLTFLRKLRRSFIDSSSAQKYIVYAIGEIALVVIGILIALQINNWNENSKHRANEIKIYKEIINDLEECKQDIESDLENHEELIRGTIYVRNHVFRRMPLNDSLLHYLEFIHWDQQFYPKKSAFESLQSLGLYTLTNDSVRLAITDLYHLSFVRLEKRGREGDSYKILNMMRPYINKHMVLVEETGVNSSGSVDYNRSISNYKDFLNDQQFLEALQWLMEERRFKIRNFHRNLPRTERVINMVKDELERLEN
jgi:hypothetical protein